MQTASDEALDIQKFDVKKTMNMWTQLEYYPVLEVTQHNINDSFVKITLQNYNSSKLLWIPVTWIKRQITSGNIEALFLKSIWFEPSKLNEFNTNYISLYDNNIIINIEQAGKFQNTKFIVFKYTYNNIYIFCLLTHLYSTRLRTLFDHFLL